VEEAELRTETSTEEVREAIKPAQTGKCPGHSSITYEFWKTWKEPKKNRQDNNDKRPISISSILQSIFNDIERHRIEDEAYTKGVMSLIFKKKDKMKIENYRTITLLETDYKIHTKTVANKLGKVCQNLIHKDQAGFILGRSLFVTSCNTHEPLLMSFWPVPDPGNQFCHIHTTSEIPRTKFPCSSLVFINS